MSDPDKVIEVAGKGIDVARDLGKFLDKIFGPPAQEAGHLLADQIRFWKLMRMLRFKELFDSELRRRDLSYSDLKTLPLGQSVPLLEAASMEDTDELQDLWAGLLASMMDVKSGIYFKKLYIGVLKEVGPPEAAILDVLWRFLSFEREGVAYETLIQNLTKIASERWRRFTEDEQISAISNLRRLGCIAPEFPRLGTDHLLITETIPSRTGRGRGQEIAVIDPRRMRDFVRSIVNLVREASGATQPKLPRPEQQRDGQPMAGPLELWVPELRLQLTHLGIDLMAACHGEQLSAHPARL